MAHRPFQLTDAVGGAIFQLAGAVEKLEARTQRNVEYVYVLRGYFGNFLNIEVEQCFPVLRQLVGQTADLHHLLFAGVQAKQPRRGRQRDGCVGIVLGGVDPALYRVGARAGVGDHHRGAAFVAVENDTCGIDGERCLSGLQHGCKANTQAKATQVSLHLAIPAERDELTPGGFSTPGTLSHGMSTRNCTSVLAVPAVTPAAVDLYAAEKIMVVGFVSSSG
ncbi:hypothetical protein D3C81_854660 [compost metagenome]